MRNAALAANYNKTILVVLVEINNLYKYKQNYKKMTKKKRDIKIKLIKTKIFSLIKKAERF